MSSCSSLKQDFRNLNYVSLKFSPDEVHIKPSITEQEFIHDMTLLRYALDRAYGAKGTISDDVFKNVDKELKNLHFISSPQLLCQKIGEILIEFPDNHLKTKYLGDFCYQRKINKNNVGQNLNVSKNPWRGIKTKDGIYTIAISRFTPGNWPGFFEFVDEAKNHAKSIIIDLRGNNGGDDTIGYKLAEKLADQKIETPIAPDIKRNTTETLTIWENMLTLLKVGSSDKNLLDQIDIYLNNSSEIMNKVLNGEIEEFTSKPLINTNWKYDQSKGFQGKIYILQNKDCGSSCESTIDFFEYFPNVTKVGYNTMGMIHFGNIGIVVLPHSSIQINIATKSNRYKDGRFIEFTGIKPDIELVDGQDAYKYVLSKLFND